MTGKIFHKEILNFFFERLLENICENFSNGGAGEDTCLHKLMLLNESEAVVSGTGGALAAHVSPM